MSQRYANYTTSDFDNFDCVKISKGIYLLLAFVLRGYLVWIMSVTNMQDRVGIIQWIFPDPKLFYLSLISGAIGLYIVLILSLRRPDANDWVKSSWKNLRLILFFALIFDFCVNLMGYLYWQQVQPSWLIVNFTLMLAFTVFLVKSQRVKLNIEEFPEKLPEK